MKSRGDRTDGILVPVLSQEEILSCDDATREVLLSQYTELCSAWRMLTDVRFKLLALIPPVAALALTGIVSAKGPLEGTGRWIRLAAAAFGLLVTTGLYIYDRRNSKLYFYLLDRARRIELDLNVVSGLFKGRPPVPPRSLISHGVALNLVYGVVLAAWIGAAIAILLGEVPVSPSS